MAHFTVHDTPKAQAMSDGEPKQILVKEGFSWSALSLPGVWFLGHGHFVSFLGYLLFVGGVGAAAFYLTASLPISAAAVLAANLLVAFEANNWRRFLLKRRGFPPVEMATGVTARAAWRAYSTEIKAPTLTLPKAKPDLNRLRDFDDLPVTAAPEPAKRATPPTPPAPPVAANRRLREAALTPPAPADSASGFDSIMQFAGLRDRPFVSDFGSTGHVTWHDRPDAFHGSDNKNDTSDQGRVNIGRRRRRRR